MDYLSLIEEHAQAIADMKTECLADISRFAEACREAIAGGHTVYLMGNGGSACDCQHFAAELVGRFQKERRAMASVALTTDTSILTALANDYGFEAVFVRQVEALAKLRNGGNQVVRVEHVTVESGAQAVIGNVQGGGGGGNGR